MSARAYPQLVEAAAACPTPLALALDDVRERLAREVERFRARGLTPLDELRGLYVSEDRVGRILRPDVGLATRTRREPGSLSDHLLGHPAWRALRAGLAPSPVERDLVLLSLARELRLDYELVFGFLNDDLTRRWPTPDLAIRLLAADDEETDALRGALSERAPLADAGVITFYDNGANASSLAAGFGLTPLATALLTDSTAPEHRLPPGVRKLRRGNPGCRGVAYDTARVRLTRILRDAWSALPVPAVILEGRDGSGRTSLALDLAAELECDLLQVDVRIASTPDTATPRRSAVENAVAAALLWQRLSGAVLLVDGAADWCARDDVASAPPRGILERLAAAAGPVLFRLPPDARWHAALGTLRTTRVALSSGSVTDRAAAWRHSVRATARVPLDEDAALMLGDRFDVTPGSVDRVVRRATDEGTLEDADGSDAVARFLAESARSDSCDALAGLATRAPTPHGWDDLILPAPTMARLRDFAAAVRDRSIVLDRWGFGKRVTRARGVTALFAGAPGTGKTMAASVLASELDLDLFVVDLATITSKYIGETEKQLQRSFRAARDAGAILFFDEADALFGKRSEVKDAHDRYANIEVAYLLQQLDVHDGIVILCTNLSRNLDAAFSRRMRYVLEFPLPSEADRLRLWRGIFPREARIAPDVDLEFLATRFALSGGDIRNVALESAYLAAADASSGEMIAMRHVIRAMARQMTKQGKTPSAAEFGPHVALIDRDI